MTAYTMLMDVVLAVMPIRVFWSLQMSKKTKISLCSMMSLTLLSAIITAVKSSYLWLFTGSKDPRTSPGLRVLLLCIGSVDRFL